MTYFADGGAFFLLANQDTARVSLDEFGTHVFIHTRVCLTVGYLGTQWTSGPSILIMIEPYRTYWNLHFGVLSAIWLVPSDPSPEALAGETRMRATWCHGPRNCCRSICRRQMCHTSTTIRRTASCVCRLWFFFASSNVGYVWKLDIRNSKELPRF